ncbi:ATP-binding protein [Bacillus sp. JJ634]
MKSAKLKSIIVYSILLLLLFIMLNMFTSIISIKKSAEKSSANQMLEVAKSIAGHLDVDAYKRFLENPVKNQEYSEIKHYLEDARKKTGALHVYTLDIDNPKVSRAMIAAMPNNLEFPIGGVCTVPEKQVKMAYEGRTFYTSILEDPEYGEYLTVGAPIKDDKDKIIGYLAIDISADEINNISGKVIKSSVSIFVFNGLFVVILLIAFLIMHRWYRNELQTKVGDTEETYHWEFQSLLASVRSLRHDFSNHVQVIHGLLKLGESEKALDYISALAKEIHSITSMNLNVNNPGLSVLLEVKRLAAQNYNIETEFEIADDSFDRIKTTDLIKLLSNVVDNAIEATSELPENERFMHVACKVCDSKYVFEVSNTGPMITDKNREKIFKSGFSTKKVQEGKVRGQGLFIVKQLVTEYRGDISIQSNINETTVTLRIPIPRNGESS